MFTDSQMTTSPLSKSIAQTGDKIYQTNNYSIFSFIKGNREINEAKVKALVTEIRKNGLLLPIMVNEKMQIIDGQHRFSACKILGAPVTYFIRNKASIEMAANINVAGSNWSLHDWINKYAEDGNEDYIYLRDWVKKCQLYNVPARSAVMLAQNSTTTACYYVYSDGVLRRKDRSSKNGVKKIYRVGDAVTLGKWQAGDRQLAEKLLTQLVMFSEFPFYRKNTFVSAFIRVSRIKEFDMEGLYKQAVKRPGQFKNQAGVNEFMEMFEKTYNYGRAQKNKVAVVNNPQLIK